MASIKSINGTPIVLGPSGLETHAVTNAKIANEAVSASRIGSHAVQTDKIATLAVTTEKIATGAVSTAKIADSAITTAKMANKSVTAEKLADNSVAAVKIVDGSVTGAKIGSNAVTGQKIADSSITASKIADGAVTDLKLQNHKVNNPLDGYGHPSNGTRGQILRTLGNGNTEWSSVGLPTDEQIMNAVDSWLDDHPEAVTTVEDGAVTTQKLADGAVTGAKIAQGAVSSGNLASKSVEDASIDDGAVIGRTIASGAVTEEKLSTGAVATGKLADGAVTTAKLADTAVTSAKIDGGAVTSAKIATGAVTFEKIDDEVRKGYVRAFDTVEDMQSATDLEVGMICHTSGFHTSGDGGAAYYTISANGTANGMDVLSCANSLYATLIVTEPYVMPEMFGAYGDGVHDDAAAINRMFSYGGRFFSFSPETYKINSPIDIDTYGVNIIGNGCTIDGGSAHGLRISETSHDIDISGINFLQSFTVGSTALSNYGLGIIGTSTTALYQAYNIRVSECSFTGGVFGINATNVMNLEVCNCDFGSFIYKPSDSAGGYAILEQSCVNVHVHDCNFSTGDYGRHSVYVSVSQVKTDNLRSQNVTVERCLFDNSGMTKQASGAFYSDNTAAIVIRHGTGISVRDCTLMGGTAIVSAVGDEGAVVAEISDCTVIDGRFISETASQNEARSAINISCPDTDSEIRVNGIKIESAETLLNDASLSGGIIEYGNSSCHYRIYIGNVTRLYMHDLRINDSGTLQYGGSGTLVGKFERISCNSNVNFPHISGSGNIDVNMYDDDAKSGFYIVSNGGIRYPAKANIPVTAAVNSSNEVVFTFTGCANRPWDIHAESITLGTPKIYTFGFFDGSSAANELKMRVYNTSGSQLTSGMDSKITF